MDVVRHNYNGMKMSLNSVVVETMPQHDVPDRFGQRGWQPAQDVTNRVRSHF